MDNGRIAVPNNVYDAYAAKRSYNSYTHVSGQVIKSYENYNKKSYAKQQAY